MTEPTEEYTIIEEIPCTQEWRCVVQASSEEEALEIFEDQSPSLILVETHYGSEARYRAERGNHIDG